VTDEDLMKRIRIALAKNGLEASEVAQHIGTAEYEAERLLRIMEKEKVVTYQKTQLKPTNDPGPFPDEATVIWRLRE
jgi:hypothetical protein